MGFPATLDELREQGYRFDGQRTCKGCGADIEWWETPSHKKIPMDQNTATPHWSTCPERDQFKGGGDKAPTSKVTTATLNMDWLKEQAKTCYCVVCKKITGR